MCNLTMYDTATIIVSGRNAGQTVKAIVEESGIDVLHVSTNPPSIQI